ncbi:MAG: S-formylglutathione hydrolase [Devosiaceae bacterium]|nr:S-formylglutathione hydrolase [Devosiaceae bacterium]
MKVISEQKCFGGTQGFYTHKSKACNGTMRFGVFVPPQAKDGPVPVLTWLAGLTCTEETFVIKAGAQRVAAELGLILVTPDTSARAQNIAGEDDDWDFGTGAGFYLDATEQPWCQAYNMQTYVTKDLQQVVGENFSADLSRQGIFGHSMGGHGALTLHLKYPELYKSISAFAPICAPMSCPWGKKAFSNYLGADQSDWVAYDASELIRQCSSNATILVDQGLADQFLEEQLLPQNLEAAAEVSGQKLILRSQEGYDHSYYFIQTFIEDHLRHHAAALL